MPGAERDQGGLGPGGRRWVRTPTVDPKTGVPSNLEFHVTDTVKYRITVRNTGSTVAARHHRSSTMPSRAGRPRVGLRQPRYDARRRQGIRLPVLHRAAHEGAEEPSEQRHRHVRQPRSRGRRRDHRRAGQSAAARGPQGGPGLPARLGSVLGAGADSPPRLEGGPDRLVPAPDHQHRWESGDRVHRGGSRPAPCPSTRTARNRPRASAQGRPIGASIPRRSTGTDPSTTP